MGPFFCVWKEECIEGRGSSGTSNVDDISSNGKISLDSAESVEADLVGE